MYAIPIILFLNIPKLSLGGGWILDYIVERNHSLKALKEASQEGRMFHKSRFQLTILTTFLQVFFVKCFLLAHSRVVQRVILLFSGENASTPFIQVLSFFQEFCVSSACDI